MIPKVGARQKLENHKNTQHLKYRRVSKPNRKINSSITYHYRHKFEDGTFLNDIYHHLKPSVVVWTYVRNIVLYCIPAFILQAILLFIHLFSQAVLGDEYVEPNSMQLLIIAYGICLFFAFRRISDHMAYYNVNLLLNKYHINRLTLDHIQHTDVETNTELPVLEHYRKKFNKYSLFPSVKELAVQEQIYKRSQYASDSRHDIREYAETLKENLNLRNKRAEHIAAKNIADWKQTQDGGVNEYDELVKKYKHRTIPAIREIIREVQEL